MRCPLTVATGFIVNGKDCQRTLAPFQPAQAHDARGQPPFAQAVADGQMPCKFCGSLPYKWAVPSRESVTLMTCRSGVSGYAASARIVGCASWLSADDAVYWSHSAIQAFIQRHPRWRNEPDLPIYQGSQRFSPL
jgi:hypothetical protein